MPRMLPIIGVGLPATQLTSSQRSFRTGALRPNAVGRLTKMLSVKQTLTAASVKGADCRRLRHQAWQVKVDHSSLFPIAR